MKNEQPLKELTPDSTFDQIRSADKKAANLLASIGLEPSRYKDETLRSVCKQRQWSEVEVLKWIKNKRLPADDSTAGGKAGKEPDFGEHISAWSAYMQRTFYAPNNDLLKEIKERFPRVHQLHGNQYPWLKTMQWHFEKFSEDLQLYLKFMQKKFFPLVESIEGNTQQVLDGTLRKIEWSFDIIAKDQDRLANLMKTMREKGNDFKNPTGACTTYRIVNHDFKKLDTGLAKQFEKEKEMIVPLARQKLNAV